MQIHTVAVAKYLAVTILNGHRGIWSSYYNCSREAA